MQNWDAKIGHEAAYDYSFILFMLYRKCLQKLTYYYYYYYFKIITVDGIVLILSEAFILE